MTSQISQQKSSTSQQKSTSIPPVLVSAHYGLRFKTNLHLNQRHYDDSNEDLGEIVSMSYDEYIPSEGKTRNAANGRQKKHIAKRQEWFNEVRKTMNQSIKNANTRVALIEPSDLYPTKPTKPTKYEQRQASLRRKNEQQVKQVRQQVPVPVPLDVQLEEILRVYSSINVQLDALRPVALRPVDDVRLSWGEWFKSTFGNVLWWWNAPMMKCADDENTR